MRTGYGPSLMSHDKHTYLQVPTFLSTCEVSRQKSSDPSRYGKSGMEWKVVGSHDPTSRYEMERRFLAI